jgi:hypothetical protein
MTEPLSNGLSNASRSSGSGSQREKKRPPLPDIEDLLWQLQQLNVAILLGLISARDGAVMQKGIKTMLDVLLRRSSRDESRPGMEGLAEYCRKNPEAIDLLQAFLSEEQLQTLMQQIGRDDDDSI